MKILSTLATFTLCNGVLLFSVNFVAYNKNFYDAQFTLNDTAEILGITQAELGQARDKMIDYISGKTNTLDIDFFTPLEKSHMKDARSVFIAVKTLSYILLIVGIATLIALFIYLYIKKSPYKKQKIKLLLKGITFGSGTFLVVLAIIGVVGLIDFNLPFIIFHKIFFPQGNWQFDSSSAMITMLPESFFTNAVWIIAGTGIGFATLLTLTSAIINARIKPLQKNLGNGEGS